MQLNKWLKLGSWFPYSTSVFREKEPPDGTVTAIQCVNCPTKAWNTGTTRVLRDGQVVNGIHPFTLCLGCYDLVVKPGHLP